MKEIKLKTTEGAWSEVTDREQSAFMLGIAMACQFIEQDVLASHPRGREIALGLAEKISVLRWYDMSDHLELRQIALEMLKAIEMQVANFEDFIIANDTKLN